MLVPSGAVVKQFVQTSLHKLLARVGAALQEWDLRGSSQNFEIIFINGPILLNFSQNM